MSAPKPSHLGFGMGLRPSLFLIFLFGLTPLPVNAAGKKPASPPQNSCNPNGNPSNPTPHPVRQVVLEPIDTTAFNLPNGSNVSMADSLQAIFNTVVASSQALSPVPALGSNPCKSYLAIHPTVTEFQMDIATAGVSFGYNPSPAGPVPIPGSTSVTGTAQVKVGSISMDFELKRYIDGQWAAPIASHADQTSVSQAQLSLQLDFSSITTGPSFVYTPQVESIFRAIMTNGITQIAQNPQLNELPWQAIVKDYVPGTPTNPGALIFDAGIESHLAPNQTFTVFSPTDATITGTCDVYCPVADIHTTEVDVGSSTAVVDQIRPLQCGNLQPGDVVKIRPASGSQ